MGPKEPPALAGVHGGPRERWATSAGEGGGPCASIQTKTAIGTTAINPAMHGIQTSGTCQFSR